MANAAPIQKVHVGTIVRADLNDFLEGLATNAGESKGAVMARLLLEAATTLGYSDSAVWSQVPNLAWVNVKRNFLETLGHHDTWHGAIADCGRGRMVVKVVRCGGGNIVGFYDNGLLVHSIPASCSHEMMNWLTLNAVVDLWPDVLDLFPFVDTLAVEVVPAGEKPPRITWGSHGGRQGAYAANLGLGRTACLRELPTGVWLLVLNCEERGEMSFNLLDPWGDVSRLRRVDVLTFAYFPELVKGDGVVDAINRLADTILMPAYVLPADS